MPMNTDVAPHMKLTNKVFPDKIFYYMTIPWHFPHSCQIHWYFQVTQKVVTLPMGTLLQQVAYRPDALPVVTMTASKTWTKSMIHKKHTRFCCDAWSRNCCAVSNSVLSNNTNIKPYRDLPIKCHTTAYKYWPRKLTNLTSNHSPNQPWLVWSLQNRLQKIYGKLQGMGSGRGSTPSQ